MADIDIDAMRIALDNERSRRLQYAGKRVQADTEPAYKAPLALARGWAAGAAGLPGDLEKLARMAGAVYSGAKKGTLYDETVDTTPVLPTSEFYKEWLPGKDTNPYASLLTDVGALTSGMGSSQVGKAGVAAGKLVGRAGLESLHTGMQGEGLMGRVLSPAAPAYIMNPFGKKPTKPIVDEVNLSRRNLFRFPEVASTENKTLVPVPSSTVVPPVASTSVSPLSQTLTASTIGENPLVDMLTTLSNKPTSRREFLQQTGAVAARQLVPDILQPAVEGVVPLDAIATTLAAVPDDIAAKQIAEYAAKYFSDVGAAEKAHTVVFGESPIGKMGWKNAESMGDDIHDVWLGLEEGSAEKASDAAKAIGLDIESVAAATGLPSDTVKRLVGTDAGLLDQFAENGRSRSAMAQIMQDGREQEAARMTSLERMKFGKYADQAVKELGSDANDMDLLAVAYDHMRADFIRKERNIPKGNYLSQAMNERILPENMFDDILNQAGDYFVNDKLHRAVETAVRKSETRSAEPLAKAAAALANKPTSRREFLQQTGAATARQLIPEALTSAASLEQPMTAITNAAKKVAKIPFVRNLSIDQAITSSVKARMLEAINADPFPAVAGMYAMLRDQFTGRVSGALLANADKQYDRLLQITSRSEEYTDKNLKVMEGLQDFINTNLKKLPPREQHNLLTTIEEGLTPAELHQELSNNGMRLSNLKKGEPRPVSSQDLEDYLSQSSFHDEFTPRNKAKGGEVSQDAMRMALSANKVRHKGAGGIIKKAAQIIGKAAESAGMARPVTATKDLTTLQDFHTSLGDRVRQAAIERQDMIESTPFLYDKGQRVFTKSSSDKNHPPFTILDRTLVGNDPMRSDHPQLGPNMGKAIKDPQTGKTMRTPREPGYRVRQEFGPDDWHEYNIPESAILGDVEMARGGIVRKAEGGEISQDAMRMALLNHPIKRVEGGEAEPTPEQMKAALTPYVGNFYTGKRAKKDTEPAWKAAVALGRGAVAGFGGLLGDTEQIGRMIGAVHSGAKKGTLYDETVDTTPVLPTSEFYKEWLPFKDDNPYSELLTDVGGLTAGMGLPQIGKAGVAVGKLGAGAIHAGMQGEGLMGKVLAPVAPLNVMKQKGGNWIGGNVEARLDTLKRGEMPNDFIDRFPAETQFDLRSQAKKALGFPEYEGGGFSAARDAEITRWIKAKIAADKLDVGLPITPTMALNNFVDKQMTRYIKNEMSTPEDPIRLMADAWPAQQAKLLEAKQTQIDKAVSDMEKARQARGFTPEMMTSSQARIRDLEKEKELIELQVGLHVYPEELNILPDMLVDKFLQEGQKILGKSHAAKSWEGASDLTINSQIASDYANAPQFQVVGAYPKEGFKTKEAAQAYIDQMNSMTYPGLAKSLKENPLSTYYYGHLTDNPWLSKLDPMTPVYTQQGYIDDIKFDHIIDELRNATNPASGLPKSLQIEAKDLAKYSMPQAVERVDKINAWRASQKAEADIVRANNAATVLHKDYPEKGMRWVELKAPKVTELPEGYEVRPVERDNGTWYAVYGPDNRSTGGVGRTAQEAIENENFGIRTLEDALKYEGEQLQHCVGGYCPDVISGKSQIFSLRDKGAPQVTIEVKPQTAESYYHSLPPNERHELLDRALNYQSQGHGFETNRIHASRVHASQKVEALTDYIKAQGIELLPAIAQIRGINNRAPAEKYLPMVHDFVKSGKWSDVSDLRNIGMLKSENGYITDAEAALIKKDKGLKRGGVVSQDAMRMAVMDKQLRKRNG